MAHLTMFALVINLLCFVNLELVPRVDYFAEIEKRLQEIENRKKEVENELVNVDPKDQVEFLIKLVVNERYRVEAVEVKAKQERQRLKSELQNERQRSDQAIRNLTKISDQMIVDQEVIWQATARAAIDDFETIHSEEKGVKLDKSNLPKGVSYREQTRHMREQRWKWMFAEKKNEYRVKELIDLIQNSNEFKSTDEFAYFISLAYNELSDQLKIKLLTPSRTYFSINKLTMRPKANKALKLFLSRLDFSPIDVREKEVTAEILETETKDRKEESSSPRIFVEY